MDGEQTMYKDSAQKTQELLDEAVGLFGMMEEVSLKCKLLKMKARTECKALKLSWDSDRASEDLTEEVYSKVSKMHVDLDTYSHRLEEIYEELREINGLIFEMDET